MARNTSTVYLGFEDEPITEDNKHLVDFTTNTVGGQPTWPASEISISACPICGLRRPLVLQIYAPLETSPLHRMLYLFACVNAVCSTQSRGWHCVRVQHLDRQQHQQQQASAGSPVASKGASKASAKAHKAKAKAEQQAAAIRWCSGQDDWGDDDDAASTPMTTMPLDVGDGDHHDDDDDGGGGAVGGAAAVVDLSAGVADSMSSAALSEGAGDQRMDLGLDGGGNADENCNEEPNGNVVPVVAAGRNDNCMSDDDEDDDDDDDDSPSLDDDPLSAFGQLKLTATVQRTNANDDRSNANNDNEASLLDGGAMGRLHSPNAASAEIEGTDEPEMVTIDAPAVPKRDLIAMLKQTQAVPSEPGKIVLRGFYVAVWREEQRGRNGGNGGGGGGGGYAGLDEHVRELLHEYQSKDEKLHTSPGSPGAAGGDGAEAEEKYEKGVPMHGDMMFHNFVSTIRENPGQILRYSRDTLPILMAPLPETLHELPPCEHCGGPTLCELQLLPTVIPLLRFAGNGDAAPLEFGNVLVLTCRSSCWDTPDRMRTEQVLVQAEN